MTTATYNSNQQPNESRTALNLAEASRDFTIRWRFNDTEGIRFTIPVTGTAHKTAFIHALHLHLSTEDMGVGKPLEGLGFSQDIGDDVLIIPNNSTTREKVRLFSYFAMEGLYDMVITLHANPNYEGNIANAFREFVDYFTDIYDALQCECDEHAEYIEQEFAEGEASSCGVLDDLRRLFDFEPSEEILAGVMSLPITFQGQSEPSFEVECHPAVLLEAMNRVVEENAYLLDSAGLVPNCSCVTEKTVEPTLEVLNKQIIGNLQIPTFYLTNGNVNAKKMERIRAALEQEARVLTEAYLANNSQ